MSHFTTEEVKQELNAQQTINGFMSNEIAFCSIMEEEEFFSTQYSEDESGVVGDINQLIAIPELEYSGNLYVYLPILKMVDPTADLSDKDINAIWSPTNSDDLLDMEGIPMPYGKDCIVTGSLRTFNYLIRNGICIKLTMEQKFVCKP